MTEMDPDWTPDAAYDILRDALQRFILSDASVTRLYDWLLTGFATPPETPSTHPAECLFKLALVDVSVFLQCDFERSDLAESLHDAIAIVESGSKMGFTKITRSPCFVNLIRTGQVPAPIIDLAAQRVRREREEPGFREI